MKPRLLYLATAAMMLVAGTFILAQGAAEPATRPTSRPTRGLVKPWTLLTTLTDEQKQKLAAIHEKALEQINKIKDQEDADSRAVLTDAQKQELKDAEEKDKVDRKLREAARATATKPAGK
jgi:hypothetical protein